jgi:hypothetical protein
MDGSYGAGPGGSMAAMAAMGDGGMGAGMGGMAERPPSAKQVAFAEQLAAEQQLPRPTFQNAAEASAYIEVRLAHAMRYRVTLCDARRRADALRDAA